MSTEELMMGLDASVGRHVEDLRALILEAFPDAEFVVYEGDDPVGVYLAVVRDGADGFDVLERVSDWLTDLLLDEGVVVHVVPVHRTPPESPGVAGSAYRRYPTLLTPAAR